MVQTSEYIYMKWPHQHLHVDVHVFILFAKLFIAINNHFYKQA